eukprot:gb/GFBE01030773.1/.p2 GENE.gb/GFBE01030773.1/~~gb/GFBE01030773.1/.p2  ORF type:complete len:208 (-),score=26.08 gb/GFBE01030773.1/:47-670(-)
MQGAQVSAPAVPAGAETMHGGSMTPTPYLGGGGPPQLDFGFQVPSSHSAPDLMWMHSQPQQSPHGQSQQQWQEPQQQTWQHTQQPDHQVGTPLKAGSPWGGPSPQAMPNHSAPLQATQQSSAAWQPAVAAPAVSAPTVSRGDHEALAAVLQDSSRREEALDDSLFRSAEGSDKGACRAAAIPAQPPGTSQAVSGSLVSPEDLRSEGH